MVGELGCGSGVLQAWAWGEGWDRTSGLGPNISDRSEEGEQSSVGLARRASSSGERSKGIQRGCCEGPGASSSSSSWGIQGEKGRRLQKEGKGIPAHGLTSCHPSANIGTTYREMPAPKPLRCVGQEQELVSFFPEKQLNSRDRVQSKDLETLVPVAAMPI